MRFVAFCLLAGLLLLPFDLAISSWLINDALPSDIRAVFHRVESFGHTYGLICIAITIYLLDPPRRKQLAHLVTAFAFAGLTADLIKLQIWRVRPRSYFDLGLEGSTFAGSFWSSFSWDWSIVSNTAYHSFPSAHTACAVALAIHLGRLYPAGRVWFMVLAALCAMNRVDGGAHYASDVCWGAAVGFLVAVWMPEPIGLLKSLRRIRPSAHLSIDTS